MNQTHRGFPTNTGTIREIWLSKRGRTCAARCQDPRFKFGRKVLRLACRV